MASKLPLMVSFIVPVPKNSNENHTRSAVTGIPLRFGGFSVLPLEAHVCADSNSNFRASQESRARHSSLNRLITSSISRHSLPENLAMKSR